MPELPDVELFRRHLDATSLAARIGEVEVRSDRIVKDRSRERLTSELRRRSFESTRRHGKHLFVHLDDGRALALHFGMTGRLHGLAEDDEEPKHTQLLVRFENGRALALVMPRKLGGVELVEDVDAFIDEHSLGPDAASEAFDWSAFSAAMSQRRGTVKGVLMNQEVMAGIGNVYSDEILFQAGLHPRRRVGELDDEALRELFETTRRVLRASIDHDADPARLEGSFLLAHREQGAACPRCGGEVERIEVAGRSAYYCPSCQS